MITGFNTDVEQDGVIYHVQTEDKGLNSPLILSLVYTGGTILASKRVPYDDLIAEGFDERILAERLNRQHKLICAAIRTGRIEDLKRMSEREATARAASRPATAAKKAATGAKKTKKAPTKSNVETSTAAPHSPAPREFAPANSTPVASGVSDSPPLSNTTPSVLNAPPPATPEPLADSARDKIAATGALHLSLLDEQKFHGGDEITLRIHVGRGADGSEVVSFADVSVKILGSTFRPLLFSTKTDAEGFAIIDADLPHFTTGRAAILVHATSNGDAAELRRIIQQG